MTFSKRGLGRGLEVLLADVAIAAGMQPATEASDDIDDRLAIAEAIIENLRLENQTLLSEIAQLKNLLDELEAIIRGDLN